MFFLHLLIVIIYDIVYVKIAMRAGGGHDGARPLLLTYFPLLFVCEGARTLACEDS